MRIYFEYTKLYLLTTYSIYNSFNLNNFFYCDTVFNFISQYRLDRWNGFPSMSSALRKKYAIAHTPKPIVSIARLQINQLIEY